MQRTRHRECTEDTAGTSRHSTERFGTEGEKLLAEYLVPSCSPEFRDRGREPRRVKHGRPLRRGLAEEGDSDDGECVAADLDGPVDAQTHEDGEECGAEVSDQGIGDGHVVNSAGRSEELGEVVDKVESYDMNSEASAGCS